jgi:hypothetical protein
MKAWAAGLVLLSAVTAMAQEKSLTFDGRKYHLDFQSDTRELILREYVPAGQTVKNWTSLVALRVFVGLRDPLAYARGFEKQIVSNNPDAGTSLMQSETKEEVILDFFTWERKGDKTIGEFNVWRIGLDPKGRGLVALQFALRTMDLHGDKKFQAELKDRLNWVRKVAAAEFPPKI